MRTLTWAFIFLVGLAPTPALAQAASNSAATGRCSALAADWRNAEIELADHESDSLGDNSAPRATMRAAEDTAIYAQAAITLRLIELNHCPPPSRAPASATFLTNALSCKAAIGKANIAQIQAGVPECNRATWTQAGK